MINAFVCAAAALKAEAEELFQRALNFGFLPDYLISCRGSYGGLLMRMGRIEEAVAQMRTALDQVNEAKKQGRPIMATEQEIYFVKEEFKRVRPRLSMYCRIPPSPPSF